MFRAIIVISFTFFSLGCFGQPSGGAHILTYKEWKVRRVSEAKSVHQQLVREYKRIAQSSNGRPRTAETASKLTRLHRRVDQSRFNVDLAEELTAHDYFVAYITEKFPRDSQALQFALKHFSVGDVKDILIQYQTSLAYDRTTHPRALRTTDFAFQNSTESDGRISKVERLKGDNLNHIAVSKSAEN